MKRTAAINTGETWISIVDDQACVRESLSSLIRSEGYRTKEYASAEDFLARERADESACVILDVHLPGMNGFELQQQLAKTNRERPIVFISGNATEKERALAMVRGAVAFLCKPFRDESLLMAVRDSIARGIAAATPKE